ncbi:hypothetical protein A2721_03150 [Candidatus Gottesmanbacteria bacterium RIFCSPHIGHO2_01_FULL_47_48]|uniref:M23ase beta-sheet core domain-containing protein n=1 Tax=Candidatus Gottesmanbacteria bacterium RIFCSPHIGHO2_01_FULL_47_48 TaxID=1798381 RepID=A0A1F5ZZ99_9BACT|nr:MAG: hypothetical protein A2721_03150 [Candidatus Gottesmanbacteria bacterium RIFCSPHIGHO2_01_FULL_47_48]
MADDPTSSPDKRQVELEGAILGFEIKIAADEKKLEKLQKDLTEAFSEGEKARDIRNSKSLEGLKKSLDSVSKSAARAAEEASELGKWAVIASGIAQSPETSPFKLMIKTLNQGFKYITYSDRAISADRIFNDWVESLKGKQSEEEAKREKLIREIFFGPEQPVTIAENFPQYFNQFHYQGNESKQIETWYSPDSWKGVSEAYYQEAAWRRSVLLELQQNLILLEWIIFRSEIRPNQELPNQPDIKDLKWLIDEMEKRKAEREEELQKYKANYAKFKASLLKSGASEENAEAAAHELSASVDFSEQANKESQAERTSTGGAPSNIPLSAAPGPSTELKTIKEKEHPHAQVAVSAGITPVDVLRNPDWVLNQLALGFLSQVQSQIESTEVIPAFLGLDPEQEEFARRLMTEKGLTSQEAVRQATLTLGVNPELANLTDSERKLAYQLMREQNFPAHEAAAAALQISQAEPRLANLTPEQKEVALSYLKQGRTVKQAIDFALVEKPEVAPEITPFEAVSAPTSAQITTALSSLPADQQQPARQLVTSLMGQGYSYDEAVELALQDFAAPLSAAERETAATPAPIETLAEFADLPLEQQEEATKLVNKLMSQGRSYGEAVTIALQSVTAPPGTRPAETATAPLEIVEEFASFTPEQQAKATELVQKLMSRGMSYEQAVATASLSFSARPAAAAATVSSQVPAGAIPEFASLSPEQQSEAIKLFSELVAKGYRRNDAVAQVLQIITASGTAAQKPTTAFRETAAPIQPPTVRAGEAPKTRTAEPGLSPLQKETREQLEKRGRGPLGLRDYTHPSEAAKAITSHLRAYFLRVFSRGPAQETVPAVSEAATPPASSVSTEGIAAGAGVAAGVATSVGTKVGKSLLSKGVDAALGAVAPQALAAKKLIEKALAVAGKVLPPVIKNALEDLKEKIKEGIIGLNALIAMHLPAFISGLIGGTVGAIAGPIGAAIGFGVGWTVGITVIEPIIGWGLASGAISAIPAIAGGGLATSITSAGGSASAFLGSGAAPPSIAVSGVAVASLLIIPIIAAFVQPSEAIEQYDPPKFTVTKEMATVEVDGKPVAFKDDKGINRIANLGNASATITYKVTFTSQGEAIKLSTPEDKAISYKSDRNPAEINPGPTLVSGTYPASLVAGESKSVVMAVTINGGSGKIYDDSRLVNSFAVTGTTGEGSNQTSQTHSAIAALIIGAPKGTQPYGFPVAGSITSLDDEVLYDQQGNPAGGCGSEHHHCGQMSDSTTTILGGLDIAVGHEGRDLPVVSTINGFVRVSTFDYTVGGKVIIESLSGEYRVAFLHLKDTGRIAAQTQVSRGQQVGFVYDWGDYQTDKLKASSGPHVHYQITQNEVNLPFATAPSGSCSDGTSIMSKAAHDIVVQKGSLPASEIATGACP